ncbi:unnamed protein product [Rhizopus microsporus]
MEDLSSEDSSISEELTSVIYTSLMSIMRLTFKQDEAAMDIDEEFEGNLEIDKGESDEKVKLKKFAAHIEYFKNEQQKACYALQNIYYFSNCRFYRLNF